MILYTQQEDTTDPADQHRDYKREAIALYQQHKEHYHQITNPKHFSIAAT